MSRSLSIVTALAAGAALMFYLDPSEGRRRRALVRDRSLALKRDAKDFMENQSTHADDGAYGLDDGMLVDDVQLRRDVHARASLLLSNPMALDISVDEGVVRLSGRLPAREAELLLTKVAAMRGVQEVDDQLVIDPDTVEIDGVTEQMLRASL